MAAADGGAVNVPEDIELKKIIDKLANFVARNGPKFEELTKTKQKDNPKFSFLFGGEYHGYYKQQVAHEEKNLAATYGSNPPGAPWQQGMGQSGDGMNPQAQMFQPPPQPEAHIQAPPQPPSDLVLSEFDTMMKKIMDSCTKDNISNGKAWIFANAKSLHHSKHIAQHMQQKIKEDLKFQQKLHLVYLINDVIHHCSRKGNTDLLKAFGDVIVVIFALTHHGEPQENQDKLGKVFKIWEKNSFFEEVVMEKLRSPDAAFSEYEAQQKALQEQQQQRLQQQQQQKQQHQQEQQQQLSHHQQQQPPVSGVPPVHQPPTSAPQPGFFDYSHGQPPQQFPFNAWPDQFNQYYQQQYNQFPPISQPFVPGYQYQQYPFPGQPPMLPPPPQGQGMPPDNLPPPVSVADNQQPPHDREQKNQGETQEESGSENQKQEEGGGQMGRDMHPSQEGNEPPQGFPGQNFLPQMPPGTFQGNFPPGPGFFQGQGPQDFSHPPPGFHDPRFPPQGPPPMGFQGPVQQFDYGHQRRPGFESNGPPPPLSFDYDHGRRMGEGPPPPPEHDPTIPLAPYYDLPAGLMVPLVKLWDCEYEPVDPKEIRLPIPQPPSERLIAAVEAFYSPPSHDRPRDSQGWEKNGLFEYFKAKLKYIKDKPRNIRVVERSPSPPPRRRSRSRSRGRRSRSGSLPYQRSSASPPYQRSSNSPPYQRRSVSPRNRQSESPPYQRRSASRSPYQRRSRSRSPYHGRQRSPQQVRSRSHSRSRSRSRSASPPYRRSSRSRSRSPQKPTLSPRRSPTPPSGFIMFESKSLDTRIEETNVGHQMLKKMGWGGEGLGRKGQGIQEPIKGGEIRDKQDQFKGIGVELNDPFEQYRRNKSYTFNRLKAVERK